MRENVDVVTVPDTDAYDVGTRPELMTGSWPCMALHAL